MFAESVSLILTAGIQFALVDTPCLEVDVVGIDLDMVEGFGSTPLVVLVVQDIVVVVGLKILLFLWSQVVTRSHLHEQNVLRLTQHSNSNTRQLQWV